MRNLIKIIIALLIAVTVTGWQVKAGIARTGSIDGGVLVLPLLLIAIYLIRGVSRDLKEVYQHDYPRKRYYR